jgi:hypothetical protein
MTRDRSADRIYDKELINTEYFIYLIYQRDDVKTADFTTIKNKVTILIF